jgi:biopolymer transport protein ExbB
MTAHSDEKEVSMTGTKQIRRIGEGLNWLAAIASMEPLLAFTATMTGMSNPIIVIEKSMSINPSMPVGSIWEALTTRAAGLLVAIPVFRRNLTVSE